MRGAREGDGLVLGWFNADEAGGGQWLMARVHNPDAPTTELVAPLPLPGLLGLYTTDAGGVRVLMTEAPHPRDGVAAGGWADLLSDGTFDALHAFDAPADLHASGSGLACAGSDAAALYVCSASDEFGATILRLDAAAGATFFTPAFDRVFGSCSRGDRVSYGIGGCVTAGGITSVLVNGHDASQPLAVAEWRPDGMLLHARPLALGTTTGELNGVVATDASGPVYFVLSGSPDPRIFAYRIMGESATLVGEARLDAFADPVAKPLGTALLPDGRIIVAYRQSEILSVIAFGDSGFSLPTIVANVSCTGGGYAAVQTPAGVYLPIQCFIGEQLTLLRFCGG